jgi:hypothetical protein
VLKIRTSGDHAIHAFPENERSGAQGGKRFQRSDPLAGPRTSSTPLRIRCDGVKVPSQTNKRLTSRFDATVRLRHCEKDAVLRPRPKRPRSVGALSSNGLMVPSVIAASNSGSLIPRPLSRIEIRLLSSSQSKCRRTSEAPADTELSTTSASAAAVEYPSLAEPPSSHWPLEGRVLFSGSFHKYVSRMLRTAKSLSSGSMTMEK